MHNLYDATTKDDLYQKRYKEHQQAKRAVLKQIIQDRHSDRVFSDDDIPLETIHQLIKDAHQSPSSCNRHGIKIKIIDSRDEKELLGGILVGGVGWVHRAKYILLLFGDPNAYKSKDEVKTMPFLDAGVLIQQIGLLLSVNQLAGCYINPNIRANNQSHFKKIFGDEIFCGAFAIGRPLTQKNSAYAWQPLVDELRTFV